MKCVNTANIETGKKSCIVRMLCMCRYVVATDTLEPSHLDHTSVSVVFLFFGEGGKYKVKPQ